MDITCAKNADLSGGPLVTIPFDHTMKNAYELMAQWGVRHLPVIDDHGVVVGVLSDSDVFRSMNPRRPGFAEGFLVADFMSWPAISVADDESLGRVASIMSTERVSSLLVTNKNHELVGIVTSEDLLTLMAERFEHKKEGPKSAPFYYAPLVREAMRELESLGI